MASRPSLDLLDASDPRVEPIWRTLEQHARPSYFLSWGWIESWLESLPAEQRPRLAVIGEPGHPQAAFFLGERRLRRHLVMTSSARFFNATGSPRHDDVRLERNGLLALPGVRRSLAGLLALLPADWDELFLPAIDRYAFDDLRAPAAPVLRYRVRIDREAAAPFVDLDAVRSIEGGYRALLASSTRAQLARAQARVGELEVEVATDADHALDIWRELLRLDAQAATPALADPWLVGLHRLLIDRRLRHGEIQLMRVRAGGVTLGCLYNVVAAGHVVFHEAGLATLDDLTVQPAYLCQAAAIEYNALAGHAIYDLLGGPSRVTHQLATGANRLIWVRVQRPLARFQLEDQARSLKRAVVAARPRLALRPA